ncbi:MAG: transmembrane 220 family protein [Myxococcota bacterium]|nr:transmembrane 220 family protein [Myxococcota bacterium]
MRLACLFAAALFSLFSYWQLNDLEQYGTRLWSAWFLAYGATAAISAISAYRLMPVGLYLGAAALSAGVALFRLSQIDWNASLINNPTNPAGNEAGGLLLVAAWLFFLGTRRNAPTAS